MTLIKMEASESDNQKHINDTHEKKGARKREFAKLAEMEVQTQLECEKLSL